MTALTIALLATTITTEVTRQTLWQGGEGGYAAYRIPAVVAAPNGTLLAFCEGRKNGTSDQGDIDLLLRRSPDGGATWSTSVILHEEGETEPITIGNPCPITDSGRGIVHLLFCRDNHDVFYTASDDNGQTWQEPSNISSLLDDFEYDVVRVATGPGHGLLTSGGRLVVPVWLCNREVEHANVEPTKDRYRSGVIFSDDDGETWQAGGLVPATLNRLNESMVIELSDGRLLLNSRAHEVGYRAQAISSDGGRTWAAPDLVTGLPDATVQASLLRHSDGSLLFSNIPTPLEYGSFAPRRRGLALKRSNDDGRTWSPIQVIEPGRSAYSDLVELPSGDVVCVFECGDNRYNERIDVVTIPLSSDN